MQTFIWIAAPLLLAGLIYAEKRESLAGKLACKPVLSLLFIATAWLLVWPHPAFGRWILTGLVFCLIGDVCLIFSSRPMFLAGLVAFLLGHVFYAVGFYVTAAIGVWSWVGLATVIAVGIPVMRWLGPHLGEMRGPVIAYVVVISLMVSGAFSMLGDQRWGALGRHLSFWGAIAFYLSDLFVARQRFVAQGLVNRAVGLPLYYAGQFAIASATAWVGMG